MQYSIVSYTIVVVHSLSCVFKRGRSCKAVWTRSLCTRIALCCPGLAEVIARMTSAHVGRPGRPGRADGSRGCAWQRPSRTASASSESGGWRRSLPQDALWSAIPPRAASRAAPLRRPRAHRQEAHTARRWVGCGGGVVMGRLCFEQKEQHLFSAAPSLGHMPRNVLQSYSNKNAREDFLRKSRALSAKLDNTLANLNQNWPKFAICFEF